LAACVLALGACTPTTAANLDLNGSGAVSRSLLIASDLLTSAKVPGDLIEYCAYAMPDTATQRTQSFRGILTLNNTAPRGGYIEMLDTYGHTGSADTTRKHLPPVSYAFIQTGSHIFPLERGSIASTHPEWEFVLAPGRVWNENRDLGYSRASMPIALQQKNANCIHDGVLIFLFKSDGAISAVAYQSEALSRMPTKPLADLATDFPPAGIDVSKLMTPNGTAAAHVSATGFITDGVHYTGSRATRANSEYPFCSTIILPSDSTAKSMFAAVAALRLEKRYPGTKNLPVKNHVPACQSGNAWRQVTLNHAMDMATGKYTSASYEVDNGSTATRSNFFLKLAAADKISFACTAYAHKVNPGTTWVHHTSDHYLAGTMMQAYDRGLEGTGKDLYTDLVVGKRWSKLQTSRTSLYARRTYDSTAQPWADWGLLLMPGDVAKIASFIGIGRGAINGAQFLDNTELNAALQRTPSDRGMTLAAPYQDYRYNNGYWAYNVKRGLGCANDAFLPFMSGSSGISVLLMQNDTVYYQFSDNNTDTWLDAAVQSNKIRMLCN
jgi:hypothetical protein